MSQLRDFVGKLGGLQAEHRAVQLRKSGGTMLFGAVALNTTHVDTGLLEILLPVTRSEIFNKSLDIQQSQSNCISARFD